MSKLQDFRESRHLTQAELAKASGVTQQAISNIETGKRKRPSGDTLYKLARALHCMVDDLIETGDKTA